MKVRITNHVGAALVAPSVAVLAVGSPAMAEAAVVPTVAADADVPDLQETSEDPDEVDSGDAPTTALKATDLAEVGVLVVQECEPGFGSWSWTGKKTPWTVTHAKGYENFTESAATYTKSATRERSITASASATSGVTVGANVAIASLDATVSYSLALSGTVTNTGSESVTATMKPGGVYIYYAGARKTSGYYTYSVCNSWGVAVTVRTKGSATSFGLKREGAVRCNTKVSSGSLGYVAERDYC